MIEMGKATLPYGPLGPGCIHVCVDMQRLFAQQTEWHAPWMARVRPAVHRIAQHFPERTIFTRFIPAHRPGEGSGTWRRYYERWASMTLDRLGPGMIDLVPELTSLVPPAEVVDKVVYSPWDSLDARLRARAADTIVVTGGETDVCVAATVLGAVDRGYRVVLVKDGVCSSSDEAHDAAMCLYERRFGQQVETAAAETVLAAWHR
jgi:nicotinamidase-related amidase